MSAVKTSKVQVGVSTNPSNNFVIDASQADGSLKISRGNAGATTQDVLKVESTGALSTLGMPAFQCRAWATFNGSSLGTNAPASGGNVDSVQRMSTGMYRVTFTTPMPNSTYTVQVSTSGSPGYNIGTVTVNSRTTAYFDIGSAGTTGTTNVVADAGIVYVSVFA